MSYLEFKPVPPTVYYTSSSALGRIYYYPTTNPIPCEEEEEITITIKRKKKKLYPIQPNFGRLWEVPCAFDSWDWEKNPVAYLHCPCPRHGIVC